MNPNGIEGLDAQFIGRVSPTAPRIQAGGHPCQGIYWTEAGKRPKVAFAADAERLSAAEDFERYQNQSLFAPKGNDNYSLARALLLRLDFDVVNVTPREFMETRRPEVPDDADLLLWMQPRRSIRGMMEETARQY